MNRHFNPIVEAFLSSEAVRALQRILPEPGTAVTLGGCIGSSGVGALAALHETLVNRVLVALASGPNQAASIEADLESLLGKGSSHLYPQRESLPYESAEPHLEVGGLRIEALEALFSGRTRLLVTTTKALQERGSVPSSLADLRLSLSIGDERRFAETVDDLLRRGFEEVPLVEQVGQFAVRGGILDVFSFGSPDPFRVEFWGDEITSIRAFDILDQRSVRTLETTNILPWDFRSKDGGTSVSRSLLELLPSDALFLHWEGDDWRRELQRTWDHAQDIRNELLEHGHSPEPVDRLFVPPGEAASVLEASPRIRIREERTSGHKSWRRRGP